MFDVLLEAGANPNFVNRHGRNAVTEAANKLNLEFVKQLVERGCPALGNSLLIPTERGHVELVHHLIAAGADVNYINTNKDPLRFPMTLLERAIHERASNRTKASDFSKIIMSLITAGADLNKIAFCRSPLNAAAHYKDSEVLQLLLKAGADANGISVSPFAKSLENTKKRGREYYDTALHEAAQAGSLEIVKTLVRYGADVQKTDHEGKTALDRAREHGHTAICELLAAM